MEYLLLLIVLQSTSILNTDGHILQERLVNVSNIIARTPFTAITSCVMKCSANDACSVVGFSEMPAIDQKLDCLHLKGVEEVVDDDKPDDYVKAIILLRENQRILVGSDPPSKNCSRFSSKGDSNTYQTDIKLNKRHRSLQDTFFSALPHEIKKDTLIATIKTWKREHRIQFQYKIDVPMLITGKYYNIIRFSNVVPTKDNNMNFGTRILFISVRKTNNGKISTSIVYWLDGKVDYSRNMFVRYNMDPSLFKNWFRIDLSQQFVNGQYKGFIKIGNDVVKEFVNTHAQVFYDVKIYAGDIHPAAPGVIKELLVQGYDGLDINQSNS